MWALWYPRAPSFSQLEATVLTCSCFLFTPQEARELLPPLSPPPPTTQEDTAGRTLHAVAVGCPGPGAENQASSSAEAEPGSRRGASPGELCMEILQEEEPPGDRVEGVGMYLSLA